MHVKFVYLMQAAIIVYTFVQFSIVILNADFHVKVTIPEKFDCALDCAHSILPWPSSLVVDRWNYHSAVTETKKNRRLMKSAGNIG